MENQELIGKPATGEAVPKVELDEEAYGLRFHRVPFLIAVVLTAVLYLMVFVAVDEYPTYIDPSDLPPPPAAG